MIKHGSVLLWQSISPFHFDNLSVPFTLTIYQSLLLWQSISPFHFDNISVSFTLTIYQSLLVWQSISPFHFDNLSAPFSLTIYQSLSLWQSISPFYFDNLSVHLSVSFRVVTYGTLLPWQASHRAFLLWESMRTGYCLKPEGQHADYHAMYKGIYYILSTHTTAPHQWYHLTINYLI